MIIRKYEGIEPGSKFFNWEVLEYVGIINHQDCYLCRCACGTEGVRPARDFVTGRSKSCGCLKRINPEVKKERQRVYKAQWFQRNKSRLRKRTTERQKEQRLKDLITFGVDRYGIKSRYGISLSEYDDMIEAQNKKCAICGVEFEFKKGNTQPCVDHDHKTGVVRGLICRKCNSALGLFNDDINVVKNAVTYLEEGLMLNAEAC